MKLYTLDNQFIEETDIYPINFTGIFEHYDGSKYWYVGGKYHRLDGPAVVHPNGLKFWHVRGELHRLDGPAFEYPDGRKEWWVDGKQITEEQHNLLHCIMKLKELI